MPRRKVPKPSAAAVAAIKEALKQGRPLSAAETLEFVSSRPRIPDAPAKPAVLVVEYKKTGQLRFRVRGTKGAGTIHHPTWIANGKKANALLTEVAKLRRPLLLRQARQERSEKTVEQVLALLKKYEALGRAAAKRVADELGVSPDYVRRIRKSLKPT